MSEPTITPRRGWLLLGGYLVVLAVILLNPSADPSAATVSRTADVLASLGVPESWVAGARTEFVLNALMFAPIPVFGAIAVPRLSASDWVSLAFVGSFAVEAVQGLLLPGRSPQTTDVVANTLGAVLGVTAWWALTRVGGVMSRSDQ